MTKFAYVSDETAIKKSRVDVENYFFQLKLDRKEIARLLIVVDEIVSNIVFYGNTDHGALTLSCDYQNDEVTLIFKDNGKKFNPLEQVDPDISRPTRERDIGGLGILLVKNMADYIDYVYKDECNILTFKRCLHKEVI